MVKAIGTRWTEVVHQAWDAACATDALCARAAAERPSSVDGMLHGDYGKVTTWEKDLALRYVRLREDSNDATALRLVVNNLKAAVSRKAVDWGLVEEASDDGLGDLS